MNSSDVRDILGTGAAGSKAPRPSKKRDPTKTVSHLSKEVAHLLGERIPSVVLQPVETHKRKFTVTRRAQPWEWQAFDNPGRNDGLRLKHWVQKKTQAATPGTPAESKADDGQAGSYWFAKYDHKVQIPTYTDTQYEQELQSKEWTREETDYLFSLARDYDLRWILIDDRYDFQSTAPSPNTDLVSALVVPTKSRTMEEMKARYYQVAAKTILLTHPQSEMTEAEFEAHDRMVKFDPERERRRKEIVLSLMSRSPEEIKEEEILLAELRRITANEEKFLEERKELYSRLDYPIANGNTQPYETSTGLQQMIQNFYYADSRRKARKQIEGSTSSPAQAAQTPTTARDHRKDGATSATTDKKKGSSSLQIRNLTADDEKKFGVSTHERLNSGVSFRSGRVEKLVLAKSQIQSAKLQDAIRELAVPLRPRMPTTAVSGEYERLITNIHTLLDARKNAEKLSNEIRVVKAQQGIGLDGEHKEGDEATKVEEDVDADGEVDEETNQQTRNRADSDAEEDADDSKVAPEGDDNEDDEAADDDLPQKMTFESDDEDGDADESGMPEHDEEEEDDDAASMPSPPESPPADDDEENDGANAEDAEAEEEENERPSSSRASVARSTKSTRSARSAATGGTNKHKRSASALSVSESEKSTGTRTSKRARK